MTFDRAKLERGGWRPIKTAPKDGTHVFLMSADYPMWGAHLLYWDKNHKRWCGRALAVMGPVVTYWDEDMGAPTHWRPQ